MNKSDELRKQAVSLYNKIVGTNPLIYTAEQAIYDIQKLIQSQTLEADRLARIDELKSLYLDFDERKLIRMDGTGLVSLDNRITELNHQKKGIES